MAVAIAAIETSEDLELANKHLISDELWERVQDVRRQRTRGGCAPGKWRRGVDPLGGLLY